MYSLGLHIHQRPFGHQCFSFHFLLLSLFFWTVAFSVFPFICTSVRLQESWISHSERRSLKLLFNHFQSMLWDSKCWHSGPWLGSLPGTHFRAQWACSVICHCKGQRKWLYLSERIQFHPTITSLLCLQIFSQRKKGWSHMWCRISAFYSNHIFPQRIYQLNAFFTYLNYNLWNVI